MQIDFEEIPVQLAGINAFCLAGNFEIDTDGEITGLWVEEWGTRYGIKPKLIAIHPAKDGLAKLFWDLLRPVLRQRFADAICAHVNSRVRWTDEHRTGAFESLGVR